MPQEINLKKQLSGTSTETYWVGGGKMCTYKVFAHTLMIGIY